jgi:nucleotide-binding universal stress UspA family protein
MPTDVLVGLNGSSGSWRAFAYAVQHAKVNGARLTGLFVESPFWSPPPMGRQAFERMIVRLATTRAEYAGVPFRLRIRSGFPAHTIVAQAGVVPCDLIVLGHTGDALLCRWWSGSLSQLVQDMAPCSVVVVREGVESALDVRAVATEGHKAPLMLH